MEMADLALRILELCSTGMLAYAVWLALRM